MRKSVFVVVVGVILCNVNAQKNDDKNWKFNLNPNIENGRFRINSDLGFQKNNWGAGIKYKYEDRPKPYDNYHKLGAEAGYNNGRLSITGSGFYDSTGGWGAGINLGINFKRSLRKPVGAFYLLVEADPCQFILYDRDADGVITIEELREVFPDRNLADGLFERLDIEERGEITLKEFEAAKATGAIVGCAAPAYKETIPDESDLE